MLRSCWDGYSQVEGENRAYYSQYALAKNWWIKIHVISFFLKNVKNKSNEIYV